ncbi:MAG: DUF192 domain-containing protein [Pseudanabaenaceae cyanobacterium bins.68]|nr:DUF192 domain-containing protein [Pseudanabaenaceae cyanobacterium bins.68]
MTNLKMLKISALGTLLSILLISSVNSAPVKPEPRRAQFLPITAKARLANQVVQLEVAQTPSQKAQGLMFRDRLPDDRGMLFPFQPAGPLSFWMKNCAVPLDMIFIRQTRIVAIAHNAPPCTGDPCPIYPQVPVLADQVIELRANWAKEKGLHLGDRVVVQSIKP